MATKEELPLIPALKIKDVFERAKVDMPDTHEARDPLFKLINMAAEMATEALSAHVLGAKRRADKRDAETQQLLATVKKACANADAVKKACAAEVQKLRGQLAMTEAERAEREALAVAQSTELNSDDLSVLLGQRTEQPES